MSDERLKVLILGGYGTFGGRLARLLNDDDRVALVIAGRSAARAADFRRTLQRREAVTTMCIDRDRDVAEAIAELRPGVVVDASGPFQSYGAEGGRDPYRVARAAIAAGAHYVDLADDPGFVRGVRALNAKAWEAGVCALSGASTFPALTAAVARRLADGLARVDAIRGGVAPSPYAGVGRNVVRAIASYAGKPVVLRREGRDEQALGLIDSRRVVIGPPGALPLRATRFTLVDVPDLTLLPEFWPEVREVWMGAGPRPAVWHWALTLCAWLVRAGLLTSLTPLAPLMHGVANTARWGEHRGGLFVEIAGRDADGRPVRRSWHLIAEGDDGPFIPAMAAAAIVRAILSGAPPAPGARPAAGEVALADYEALFARRAIAAGVREPPEAGLESGLESGAPLYRRILGSAWDALPAPIRAMHEVSAATGAKTVEGRARIDRGTGPLARLIARIMGFPDAGEDVPVRVTFSPRAARRGGEEVWRRTFAAASFASVQSAGRGGGDRLLTERFGPLAFDMALVVDGERLRLVVRRWRFLGAPMPGVLAPRGESYEHVEDGRFRFHVEIRQPLAGLVVRYRGWLEPAA